MRWRAGIYISVRLKFIFSVVIALAWAMLSTFIAARWIDDIASVAGAALAYGVVFGIAIVPGMLNTFMLTGIIFDRQPMALFNEPTIPITIIIAAHDEEKSIYETLLHIAWQEYAGAIRVITADNDSSDNTRSEVLRAARELKIKLEYINVEKIGKHNALNAALRRVRTEYFITLDADTLLEKTAVRRLVSRILGAPFDVAAVAGAVFALNGRENLLCRMQEWDYFLSIASIKKMQGLYQGTLVAQGAFSIYKTKSVRRAGGWSDAIGEDIVLTWKLLKMGEKVYYEPRAVCFTEVPSKFFHFIRQRSRWARGMIEGFRTVKPWQFENIYFRILTWIDVAIIYIDFSYVFFFIPGVVAAMFGRFYIVGLMTLLVIPLTFFTFLVLWLYETRLVFRPLGLSTRGNITGFAFFVLFYQLIISPVSIFGYMQELFRIKRVWK